jgi:hypothetical protein
VNCLDDNLKTAGESGGMSPGSHFRQPHCAHSQLRLLSMRGRVHTTFEEGKCHPILPSESVWETMGIDLAVANSQHFYRLVISYWLSVSRVLGFLERLEHPCSILTGAVDAGSSVGSGDASREGSRAGVTSGGGRRHSGVLIAKDFIKIVSPPCDSSIIGAVPGGVPGTITSSSSLSSIGLDTVGPGTPW